jgi:hypothetical protein
MGTQQCPSAWRRADSAQSQTAFRGAGSSTADAELMALREPAALLRAAQLWESTAASATVPLLLHQSWKSCIIGPKQQVWRRQCERVLPSYTTWLWTDEDNRDFIRTEFPSFLGLYDSYDMHIKRVDAVRYFYLWRFGGVYMDLDFTCLRSFDSLQSRGHALIRPGRATLATNAHSVNCYNASCVPGKSEAVPNAFMAAPPRHPFFAYLIHRLPAVANATLKGHRSPIRCTGPGFLSESLRWYARSELKRHAAVTLLQKNYVFNWMAGLNSKRHPCGKQAMDVDPHLSLGAQRKLWDDCAAKMPNAALTTFWTHSWIAPAKPMGSGSGSSRRSSTTSARGATS